MKQTASLQKRTSDITRPLREWANAELLPRYHRLSLREQRLLVFAIVALPVAALIFAVWLPVRDEAAILRQKLPVLEAQWREANMLADRLKQHGKRPAEGQDILTVVNQAVQGTGVRPYITRIKPQPALAREQRLMVRMQQVPYPKLIRFLDRLAKDGVALDRVKLLRGSKPGLIDVDLMAVSG